MMYVLYYNECNVDLLATLGPSSTFMKLITQTNASSHFERLPAEMACLWVSAKPACLHSGALYKSHPAVCRILPGPCGCRGATERDELS